MYYFILYYSVLYTVKNKKKEDAVFRLVAAIYSRRHLQLSAIYSGNIA